MLDFEQFLYKEIGLKIRNYRKQELKLTQGELSAMLQTQKFTNIDKFRISAIENGKSHKGKNPYLLTDQQIETFSSMMGYDRKEFIFGDYNTRKVNVKIFLLALIMNSEKNKENNYIIPFMSFLFIYKNKKDIMNVLYKNEVTGGNETVDKYFSGIVNAKTKLEEIYPFFANEKVYEKFQNFLNEPFSKIELLSNLLIKLMFGDYEFVKYYLVRIQEICEEDNSNEVAYSFLENKGMIAGRLIGNKNGLYIFVNAFKKLWKRHEEIFVEYFNEHLFNNVNKTNFKFKHLNNNLFNNVATSEHFSSILFSLLEKDRFSIETSDGHYLFYHHMLNRYADKEVEDSIEF